MKSIVFFLVILLLALQYKLWLGDGSLPQWLHLEEKLAAQEAQNQKLAIRNQAIEADIVELQSGEQALEEEARTELGMVKEDEIYYQFLE